MSALAPIAFDWEDTDSAITYTLAIEDVGKRATGEIVFVIRGLSESEYELPGHVLESGREYKWHLTAVNVQGYSRVGTTLFTATSCIADYNGDTTDDILDFLDFTDDFATCENQPTPCGSYGNPDINGDEFVDILDFLDFVEAFSNGCN